MLNKKKKKAKHLFCSVAGSLLLFSSCISPVYAVPIITDEMLEKEPTATEQAEIFGGSQFDVPDMPESYARNVFSLKWKDLEAYYQVLESMSDYEYAMYAGVEAVFEEQMTPAERALEAEMWLPAEEGLGENYLEDVYQIDTSEIGTEQFAQFMFSMQETDADRYWDIIANMTDEQYAEFFGMHEYCQENNIYVSGNTMTAFLMDSKGKILTGDEIVLQVRNGEIVIPEDIMFLIKRVDGSEFYMYESSNRIEKIRHGTDEYNTRIKETLYSEDSRSFVFENNSEKTDWSKERGADVEK